MKALGDVNDTRSKSYAVSTKDELDALLNDENFTSARVMQVVEIRMKALDAPYGLKVFTGKNW